jgi:hypothetical protein
VTTSPDCDRLTTIVDQLAATYPAPRDVVGSCAETAWEAVRYFGATDDAEVVDLVERITERELLLRLGLEREAARLDPESHTRRAATDAVG